MSIDEPTQGVLATGDDGTRYALSEAVAKEAALPAQFRLLEAVVAYIKVIDVPPFADPSTSKECKKRAIEMIDAAERDPANYWKTSSYQEDLKYWNNHCRLVFAQE